MEKNEVNVDLSDHNREGLSLEKITHLFRVLFSKKATDALEFVLSFLDIDFEKYKESGKNGIILDIDECIAYHHGQILPKNLEKIKDLIEKGWKIVIFSNMKKSDRYEQLEKLGVKVITSKFSKPNIKGFEECLEILGLKREEVLMIGDNFLTDGGAINAGISFIKVKPLVGVTVDDGIKRTMQIFFRRVVDLIAERRQNVK